MRRQFAYLGLEFEFFDAIASDQHPQSCFESVDLDTFRLHTYRRPLPSEVGCYASHRALWQHAASEKESILVLEDDARLSDSFAAAVDVTSSLIKRFGYIRLEPYRRQRGMRLGTEAHGILQIDHYELRYLTKVPLCLLAYAVSPAAAAALVSASGTFDSPADKFIQRTWEHGVPVFDLKPAPVNPSGFAGQSTIGTRIDKRRDAKTAVRRSCYKLLGEIRRSRFDRQQLNRLADSGGSSRSSPQSLVRGLR